MLRRIKPPWVTWVGMIAGLLQACAACLLLYGGVGFLLGRTRVVEGAEPLPDWFVWAGLIWGSVALLALGGMYRNRWWGFFLEFLVVWTLLAGVIYLRAPGEPPLRLIEEFGSQPPSSLFVGSAIQGIFAFIFGLQLLSRSMRRFREERQGLEAAGG
jgi:hypothetical protein